MRPHSAVAFPRLPQGSERMTRVRAVVTPLPQSRARAAPFQAAFSSPVVSANGARRGVQCGAPRGGECSGNGEEMETACPLTSCDHSRSSKPFFKDNTKSNARLTHRHRHSGPSRGKNDFLTRQLHPFVPLRGSGCGSVVPVRTHDRWGSLPWAGTTCYLSLGQPPGLGAEARPGGEQKQQGVVRLRKRVTRQAAQLSLVPE